MFEFRKKDFDILSLILGGPLAVTSSYLTMSKGFYSQKVENFKKRNLNTLLKVLEVTSSKPLLTSGAVKL